MSRHAVGYTVGRRYSFMPSVRRRTFAASYIYMRQLVIIGLVVKGRCTGHSKQAAGRLAGSIAALARSQWRRKSSVHAARSLSLAPFTPGCSHICDLVRTCDELTQPLTNAVAGFYKRSVHTRTAREKRPTINGLAAENACNFTSCSSPCVPLLAPVLHTLSETGFLCPRD